MARPEPVRGNRDEANPSSTPSLGITPPDAAFVTPQPATGSNSGQDDVRQNKGLSSAWGEKEASAEKIWKPLDQETSPQLSIGRYRYFWGNRSQIPPF